MGVFGGVQAASIVCSLVRTKLVAIWVGTVGVGIFAVYNSAVDLLWPMALLGLNTAATRDIAAAPTPADQAATAAAVSRWTVALALAGGLVTLLLAPWLSRISFGDAAHTTDFRLLSIAILFMVAAQGRLAILQGLGRLRQVAAASLAGAIGATVAAAALLYPLRQEGIILVIIAAAGTAAIAAYAAKEATRRNGGDAPSRHPARRGRQACRVGEQGGDGGARARRLLPASPPKIGSMIRLGLYITAATAVTNAAAYALIAWLTARHGSNTAGLYQAGFTLISRYPALIFTAIAVEYFPRLASVATRPRVTQLYVSHEMRLTLTIITPLVCLMTACAPWVLRLLYSSEFADATLMVQTGIIGTILRAASWCMAFTMLTRGDGRIYLLTETISAVAYVGLNILVYDTLGLAGMGVAYIGWYAVYTSVVAVVYRLRYRLRLARGTMALALAAVAVGSAVLLATLTVGAVPALLTAALIIAAVRFWKGRRH